MNTQFWNVKCKMNNGMQKFWNKHCLLFFNMKGKIQMKWTQKQNAPIENTMQQCTNGQQTTQQNENQCNERFFLMKNNTN